MIVLDTNVISELMRARPDPAVQGWIRAQPRSTLYTASACQAEILYGIAALPDGKRRNELASAAEAMFSEDFAGRVLSFDSAAAAHYAEIAVARRRTGEPIEAFDALIAATALAARARVATRDTAGFAGCGLSLVDPWASA
ncbi:MAG: PIN domain-containing protein [Beijerinckiaceae bacterium]